LSSEQGSQYADWGPPRQGVFFFSMSPRARIAIPPASLGPGSCLNRKKEADIADIGSHPRQRRNAPGRRTGRLDLRLEPLKSSTTSRPSRLVPVTSFVNRARRPAPGRGSDQHSLSQTRRVVEVEARKNHGRACATAWSTKAEKIIASRIGQHKLALNDMAGEALVDEA